MEPEVNAPEHRPEAQTGSAGPQHLHHRAETPLFIHVPHPHIAQRLEQGPIRRVDQMNWRTPAARINSRVAILITIAVGSMWCAYLFAVLAFVSFPSAITSGNSLIIVSWIAQTFLQLVLLPVIIVGQNIQGQTSDKRAEQTYNDAQAILEEALQIQKHLSAQDVELQAQSKRLEDIIGALERAYPSATRTASPVGD